MKKWFLLVLSLAMAWELSAQETVFSLDNHDFVLGASFGLLLGRSEEIVYRDANTKNYLSQLLWEMKPLAYAGFDLDYSFRLPGRRWALFSSTAFKFGIPAKTGVMEDRDWDVRNQGYPEWLQYYSVHDNYTDKAVLIDATFGASFEVFGRFWLKPSITYSYMHFAWKAKGGSLLHPGNDGHAYLYPITVITYEQTWHILSSGVAFYGEFNRYFNAELGFNISPLVWSVGVDHHLGSEKNWLITGTMDIGLFMEPRLRFSFTPKDFLTLSLSLAYRNISGVRGDAFYDKKTEGTKENFNNITGAGYSVFDVGLTARFRLRWPRPSL